jgi:hypothetical protein
MTALEKSLLEKDTTIKGLKSDNQRVSRDGQETGNDSQKVSPRSPRDLQKMGTFLTEECSSDSDSRGALPSELLYGTADSQTLFNRVSGEMDELKAVAREMNQLQKKKKKRQKRVKKSADLNGVSSSESNGLPPVENGTCITSEAEKRQWSSTSRDSGYERDTKNSASCSARRRRRDRLTERRNSAGRQISTSSTVTDSDILLDSKTDRVGSAKSYLSDLSEYNADNSDSVDYTEYTGAVSSVKT